MSTKNSNMPYSDGYFTKEEQDFYGPETKEVQPMAKQEDGLYGSKVNEVEYIGNKEEDFYGSIASEVESVAKKEEQQVYEPIAKEIGSLEIQATKFVEKESKNLGISSPLESHIEKLNYTETPKYDNDKFLSQKAPFSGVFSLISTVVILIISVFYSYLTCVYLL